MSLKDINYNSYIPSPAKRIYIPKPNGKQRPLGLLNINDRAIQKIIHVALEAQWEAKFENCSFGFRPALSTHDALSNITKILNKGDKMYVLDADITSCFDQIAHYAMLTKINLNFPAYMLIYRFLNAGYVEKDGKFI